MNNVFERKINYYETDRMGVVHHSNYIRFMEEGRCFWLEQIGLPFETMEENGVTIPVLGVNCTYKHNNDYGYFLRGDGIRMEYVIAWRPCPEEYL